VVLGEVVAALSGTTYEEYVARRVFAPAGMSAAFLTGADPEERKARGYTRTPAGLKVASLGPGGRGSGAGGVFATAADLLAFHSALREGRLLDRERTEWMLGGGAGPGGGRARGELRVAGGGPGANAVLSSDGTWTVVVLTNHDPRAGEDLGSVLAGALQR
jgi:CubicO group peptidase (beta-lactamase class C family)